MLGGDKLFVDYAGDTVPVIVDRDWRGASGANLRRGDGRVELHLWKPITGIAGAPYRRSRECSRL
jgi:hypothetical protein